MKINVGIVGLVVLATLQGCESTDSSDAADPVDGSVNNQTDAFIEDVPMMMDSFVLQTFELDAEGEPVDVDSVVLIKEE